MACEQDGKGILITAAREIVQELPVRALRQTAAHGQFADMLKKRLELRRSHVRSSGNFGLSSFIVAGGAAITPDGKGRGTSPWGRPPQGRPLLPVCLQYGDHSALSWRC